jgi:superkiller protein 3
MLLQNADVWCNLGFLWFANNDYELAQQAFAKAKIVEPESAMAWLGNGMVARMENKDPEAQACFAQAVMLSGGSMVSDRCLAMTRMLLILHSHSW